MATPAGFTLVRDGQDTQMIEVPTSSLTAAVGDLLELVEGSTTWAAATSSSNARTRKGVVQTATSSASVAQVILVTPFQLWIAETANNGAAADNGDLMVLSDTNTVNNTGTTATGATVVFQQFAVVGAAADKRVMGFFTGLYGNPTV